MDRDQGRIAVPPAMDRERGQTMAEYAVVLCVITLAILTTITLLGDSAGNLMNEVASYL